MTDQNKTTRERAVETVDRRHGYTLEYASDPALHRAEYDLEEQRLLHETTADKACCHPPKDRRQAWYTNGAGSVPVSDICVACGADLLDQKRRAALAEIARITQEELGGYE